MDPTVRCVAGRTILPAAAIWRSVGDFEKTGFAQ